MTDHSDLIERLRAAADQHGNTGLHPYALYALAASALSSQSLSLSEAREEIERLKGLVAGIREPAPSAATPYGIIDPDYARVFTITRCIAWSEGYALTMHGSFTRDLDLLAVPWTERATEPEHLVSRIVSNLDDLDLLVKDPKAQSQATQKPHGRLAWTLTFKTFGDPRFVDLSVMPRVQPASPAALRHAFLSGFAAARSGPKVEDGDGPAYWAGYIPAGQSVSAALENSKAPLADAPSKSPLSDLSSLRKGAEVAVTDEMIEAGKEAANGWTDRYMDGAEFVNWDEALPDIFRRMLALVSDSREDGDG